MCFPIRSRRAASPCRSSTSSARIIYRTIYTNLASVSADIAAQEVVRAGQPIGTAGTSRHLGTRGHYAMTHFQLDDLEFHREVSESEGGQPRAVSDAGGEVALRRAVDARRIRARTGRAVCDESARR